MDSTIPTSCQQRALIGLVSKGVRYALLREPKNWGDSGDIDIVVSEIDAVEDALAELDYIPFSSNRSNRKYLKYDLDECQWIHLDVQLRLTFGAINPPSGFVATLIESTWIGADGIPRLNPVDHVILLIFHLAIGKGRIDRGCTETISQVNSPAVMARAELYSFLPKPIDVYLNWVREVGEEKMSEQKAIENIRATIGFQNARHTPFVVKLLRRLDSLLNGNQAIVFLGPDGAGKTTLTEPISQLRWPSVRRQFMGPARESEMRSFFYISMRLFSGLRQKYPKYNLIGIIGRGAWQVVCYFDFLDRLFRHCYFWGSQGVVIFDRYPCDMYFRKPTAWNEFLFMKLFPSPRYVFLCVGDAREIYKRKPELSVSEIDFTIELYRKKLVQYGIPFIEINTTQSAPKENIENIAIHLIEQNWFRTRVGKGKTSKEGLK